jgi:TonB family protein
MMMLGPRQLSLLIHAFILFGFYFVTTFSVSDRVIIEVPIEVTEPKEVQNLTEVKEKPKVVLKSVNEPKPSAAPKREVFGASRNSYIDESVGDEGVTAKKGNTLAKEADKTKLLDSDADSLPTPTEEYLVSQMPSVLSEVRPDYPKLARDKQLEGVVIMDVLIDEKGKVRQATVIEGPEIFRPAATQAINKFLFSPAKVDGKPVAVRIRYSLRFQLEY